MASTGSRWTRRSAATRRSALIALALLSVAARPAAAQSESDLPEPPIGATLRGWEERARLTLFDRGGAFFGRTSDQGILQRFNPKMDSEYPLDLISFSPSPLEEREWYARENGARFWAGSINHVRLVERAQLKATVPLGDTWGIAALFEHEESLEAERNLTRVRIDHTLLDSRVRAFVLGTLPAEKPQADIELGAAWSVGGGTLTAALAALDLFNDFIYEDLGVSPSLEDTTLDYRSHPFTARIAADMPLGHGLRLEGYALAMTPAEVAVHPQANPAAGFRQAERYAYAGGLLEWSPAAGTALAAYGTWVRARLERDPLPAGEPADAFDLTEMTVRGGVYGTREISERLAAETWIGWRWRKQDRIRPDPDPPTTRYRDRGWSGRLELTYRGRTGLRGTLGLDFIAPSVLGPDRVPGTPQKVDHQRLRFDLGWRFGRRALLLLGSNVDLDGDRGGATGLFDGGHGRFSIFW